jgi:5-hydroxyisourate hydrolase-like protein (transthyretin family)
MNRADRQTRVSAVRLIVIYLLACVLPGMAQQAKSGQSGPTAEAAKPVGSVTGHVYYADTTGPARLATVVLEADAKGGRTHMQSATTLPDGSFLIPNVVPGRYVVSATARGYVSPLMAMGLTREQLTKPDTATQQLMATQLPHVVVQANLAAAVDVTLQRGAAFSGTILYDDGNPAAGLRVHVLRRQAGKHGDEWVEAAGEIGTEMGGANAVTDDRGNYRLSGIPAGEYLLQVDLSLQRTVIDASENGTSMNTSGGTTVHVYSGGKLREKEATPFALKLGDERPGEDLEIPLNKLHSIAGAIQATDGHLLNGGRVELLYADDKTSMESTSLEQGDTGFSLQFVPEGDYLVRVTGAADVAFDEVANAPGSMPPTHIETRVLHSYGEAEQPVHVDSDRTGLTITVPEKAKHGVDAAQ